jgi:hypothetical protein
MAQALDLGNFSPRRPVEEKNLGRVLQIRNQGSGRWASDAGRISTSNAQTILISGGRFARPRGQCAKQHDGLESPPDGNDRNEIEIVAKTHCREMGDGGVLSDSGYRSSSSAGKISADRARFRSVAARSLLATGVCEIAGSLALLSRRLRRLAGVMLALYAVCNPGGAAVGVRRGRRLGAAVPLPRNAGAGRGVPANEQHGAFLENGAR